MSCGCPGMLKCSQILAWTTLNSWKNLKSETHLRNAQVNRASSVDKDIVKTCLIVDHGKEKLVVNCFCGLDYFISASFGSF